MTHDPLCPLDVPASDCIVCDAIKAARGEELDKFNATWRANLPLVERRAYEDGYHDAHDRCRSRYRD